MREINFVWLLFQCQCGSRLSIGLCLLDILLMTMRDVVFQ